MDARRRPRSARPRGGVRAGRSADPRVARSRPSSGPAHVVQGLSSAPFTAIRQTRAQHIHVAHDFNALCMRAGFTKGSEPCARRCLECLPQRCASARLRVSCGVCDARGRRGRRTATGRAGARRPSSSRDRPRGTREPPGRGPRRGGPHRRADPRVFRRGVAHKAAGREVGVGLGPAARGGRQTVGHDQDPHVSRRPSPPRRPSRLPAPAPANAAGG